MRRRCRPSNMPAIWIMRFARPSYRFPATSTLTAMKLSVARMERRSRTGCGRTGKKNSAEAKNPRNDLMAACRAGSRHARRSIQRNSRFDFRKEAMKGTRCKGGAVKMLAVAVVLLCASIGWAQAPANGDLNHVLAELDAAAARFHSAKADFKWDQFEQVVSSTDTQAGVIYYEGSGPSARVAIDIETADGQPSKKTVVYSGGVLKLFQPEIDQMTVFHAGEKQAQYESYLTLGFGGSGSELKKSWDITFQGMETIDGVQTAKLDLVSKDAGVKAHFSHITI